MTRGSLTQRSPVRQWLVSAVALLVLGAAIALNLYQERQRTLSREQVKLATQAQVVQVNIGQNLISVNNVLRALAKELSTGKVESNLNQRLQILSDAMPAMRTILLVDTDGIIRAANRGEVIGKDVSDRAYFQEPKRHLESDTLYVSPPFRTVLGTFTINVARVITGSDGRFLGVISAALDPAYFGPLLESVRYSPDMWVAIAHDAGDVFMMLPAREGVVGKNLLQPETFFSQHQLSGQAISAHQGIAFITNQQQLLIWATVKADGLRLDHPLFVAVARDRDEIFVGWRRDAQIQVSLYGILLLTLLIALARFHRKQREFESREAASARALQEKVQELDMILDNSSVGIAFLKNRRIVWVNKRMLELFGYTQEDLLTQSTTAGLYPSPEDYADFGRRAYVELSAGKCFADELKMRRHDGSQVWMRISGQATPKDYASGDSIWVLEDISVRKRQESELETYRSSLESLVQERTKALTQTEARASHILNSSADGLYGVDKDGLITFINPAACAMLGYTPEQAIGRSCHELFHHRKSNGEIYLAEACPALAALEKGHTVRVSDEVYWHADGHAVPIMYSVHPMIQDGQIIGSVTSFIDVTQQRAAAEARELAIAAAEHLARMRSEFLSNISHELRTPLNGIVGYADIGFRNYQNPEKARDCFEKLIQSGERLRGVVTDVLDFSDIDSGKLVINPAEFSLSDVVSHVTEAVRSRAEAKHLELSSTLVPGLPPACQGDRLRIEQVLLKLLSNAIKFSESGRITLTVSLENENLVFEVKDTGIGIEAENLNNLFNPFLQLDGSSTRKFGGTGLGLAISQRLVELMGGSIRVKSQWGEGTTVTVRLPHMPSAAH
ncbi:ATP-binding protein [Dechloromonas sp. HYN0024]|uniref:ATP-binding protein n=1 Tax=Dechloromonas sp. HYN0024 TaxID=2231055 RepID=UPI000E44BAF9|nr:ATP-binding protein [Dechloromonas sp. HYN0024]AXS79079.1 PAS domain S-box protein [Dechloromonas sp. HYN0024]